MPPQQCCFMLEVAAHSSSWLGFATFAQPAFFPLRGTNISSAVLPSQRPGVDSTGLSSKCLSSNESDLPAQESHSFHEDVFFSLQVASPWLNIVVIMCPWVSSDYWWVTSTVSCPQQPCAAPDNSGPQLLGNHQSHTWSSFFPAAFYFFPSIIVFSKESDFSWCIWHRTASVLSFFLQWCFRLHLQQGPTCSFSWWSRVSLELSPTTTFQRNQFFLSAFFTVQLSHLCTVIKNMRMRMALALASSDTSLSLVTFPNSPIAAFLNPSLPLISWLQSPFSLTERR